MLTDTPPHRHKDWLCRAGAANHLSFFVASTERAKSQVRHRFGGAITEGPDQGLTVAFPDVPEADMSGLADEVIAFARQRTQPVSEVGWWLLDETDAASLGARLLARGFDWGWKPNWMCLDLANPTPNHATPDDVTLERQDHRWHAVVDDRRIGEIIWHVVDFEDQQVGGIYGTEVDPEFRRRGIGTALTVAACQTLAESGCRYVLLNATGMGVGVYRRAGFDLIGEVGQTWWLGQQSLHNSPASAATIAFAEAIGLGDRAAAERALRDVAGDLDRPLAGGRTALEIAATCRQPGTARWLIDNGATLDVISAWDLGWKDEAITALQRDPGLANRPTEGGKLYPLHRAGQRGDLELTRILLVSRPDLTVTDGYIGKDPIEWAQLHGQHKIASLIKGDS